MCGFLGVTARHTEPMVADLERLPYTDSVVKETLRLYPPIGRIGRRPIRDLDLDPSRTREGHYCVPQPVCHRVRPALVFRAGGLSARALAAQTVNAGPAEGALTVDAEAARAVRMIVEAPPEPPP